MAGTKIQGVYSGQGNRLVFRDPLNLNESVLPVADCVFYDDFLGKIVDVTNTWTALDVSAAGNTTPAIIAGSPSGAAQIMLDATNEVQLSGYYWADQKPFILNQGVVFEARVRITTLPTGSVVAVWGLADSTNASADAIATSIWFRSDGGGAGAITVETDDSVNETSKVATGVTSAVNAWHVYRIDCADPTSIRFYIDGSPVAASTTFNMSNSLALALQPTIRIGKEAGATTVGTMEIDYVRIWQNRS